MNGKTIVQWDGPGWYAGRQDADGNQTIYRFGSNPKRAPSERALEGYGNASWYEKPPKGAVIHR